MLFYHYIGLVASERLFLINPMMDGDSDSWHRPSWGPQSVRNAWSETMSLHFSILQLTKASDMVSDQAVLQASDPTKSVGIYAPSSHRGVNEKQPLRGNTSDVMRNRMFYERHRLDRF